MKCGSVSDCTLPTVLQATSLPQLLDYTIACIVPSITDCGFKEKRSPLVKAYDRGRAPLSLPLSL